MNNIWTTDQPTEPGWYWYEDDDYGPAPVYLRRLPRNIKTITAMLAVNVCVGETQYLIGSLVVWLDGRWAKLCEPMNSVKESGGTISMSGGYFDYQQYKFEDIARMTDELINSNGERYSQDTIAKLHEAAHTLRRACYEIHLIDRLVSGDDAEDDFNKRWAYNVRGRIDE